MRYTKRMKGWMLLTRGGWSSLGTSVFDWIGSSLCFWLNLGLCNMIVSQFYKFMYNCEPNRSHERRTSDRVADLRHDSHGVKRTGGMCEVRHSGSRQDNLCWERTRRQHNRGIEAMAARGRVVYGRQGWIRGEHVTRVFQSIIEWLFVWDKEPQNALVLW